MDSTVRTRRPRIAMIIAIALVSALLIGAGVWWGTSRASAQAAADEVTVQVGAAHAEAEAAHREAVAAQEQAARALDDVVRPVLDAAETHPDRFDAAALAALSDLDAEAAAMGASTSQVRIAPEFGDEGGGLVDRMQWDRDATDEAASAEVERLVQHAAERSDEREHAETWLSRAHEAAGALATATADAADTAAASWEHAGDAERTALTSRAQGLRDLVALTAENGEAVEAWTELAGMLSGYVTDHDAARASHDQRVAQLEAERVEAERRAAEAAEQARRNAPRSGGGGGSSGGGGGGGGGGAGCTFVNWQGMVISTPCP
ncbi:hypothetical protein [Microbacterium sp. NPDC055357]